MDLLVHFLKAVDDVICEGGVGRTVGKTTDQARIVVFESSGGCATTGAITGATGGGDRAFIE